MLEHRWSSLKNGRWLLVPIPIGELGSSTSREEFKGTTSVSRQIVCERVPWYWSWGGGGPSPTIAASRCWLLNVFYPFPSLPSCGSSDPALTRVSENSHQYIETDILDCLLLFLDDTTATPAYLDGPISSCCQVLCQSLFSEFWLRIHREDCIMCAFYGGLGDYTVQMTEGVGNLVSSHQQCKQNQIYEVTNFSCIPVFQQIL